MAGSDERRVRLLAVKLTALAREHFGAGDIQPESFDGGAAALVATTAVVLADVEPLRSLGPAIAWARRREARSVQLLCDNDPIQRIDASLARKAALFDFDVTVWRVDGRSLTPANPQPVIEPAPPDGHDCFDEVIGAAGAERCVEHGVVSAEIDGLEVARVISVDGIPVLSVGVGRFDREAFTLLHGDLSDLDALRQVVLQVGSHRRRGAPAHPLNQLAPERRLRTALLRRPELVGASRLAPISMSEPRPNLRDPFPAAALGLDAGGHPLMVVTSVGIDLDLVPAAADTRAHHAPEAELLLAVPERDRHSATNDLATLLVAPARLVGIADSAWR